jgi:hypothetical protein
MPNDKPSKPTERGTINLHLTAFENPLKNLSNEDRAKIIAEMAKVEGEEYEANFRKIQELVRSASPFDILFHFAYYDLLFLDQSAEEKESEYERLRPAHVELDADERHYPYQFIAFALGVEKVANSDCKE